VVGHRLRNLLAPRTRAPTQPVLTISPRVLILTASVGAGHDQPAATLAAQLRDEHPGAEVFVEDALAVMGRAVGALSADAATLVFYRFQWVWDVGFWLFTGPRATRTGTQQLLTRLGAPGLLRLIERTRPDVIVSTYPNVTEVLGRLRRSGRIAVPVCAAITDLAAMYYWATPGADVHFITHPESVEEVRRVAGPSTAVHCVHGFTRPEFLLPRPIAAARAALGLPADGKIVLVSGGGWGVGDVEGAITVALGIEGVSQVVSLCGHNAELLARVTERFVGEPRVRAEGFSDQMPDWLAAVDVLVHSTGGLTVLEALMRGCPAISYGWGRGHLRINNRAFERFGLARVVQSRDGLRDALRETLAAPRRIDARFASLPSASSFVLALAADPA
jgi:processive 1,2-diacylglycerol beta-glucosyltransferase